MCDCYDTVKVLPCEAFAWVNSLASLYAVILTLPTFDAEFTVDVARSGKDE